MGDGERPEVRKSGSPEVGGAPTVDGAGGTARSGGGFAARLSGLGARTVFFLLLVALVVAAADRSKLQADWSADHRFSLSPSLVRILREQTTPVELVTIWSGEYEQPLQPLADALRLMAGVNPAVTLRHIDSQLDKSALADFKRRFQDAEVPGIYLAPAAGARAFKIAVTTATRQVLQREVGGGLVALRDPHPPQAALFGGHGELRADGGDEDGDDLLVRTLDLAGFQTTRVELARGSTLPADALLIIAGATAPLGARDLAAVEEHLKDGGSALVLGDDRLPQDLADLLRRYGVLLGPGIPRRLDPAQWPAFLAAGAPTQPGQVLASMKNHFAGQDAVLPHHNLLFDAAGMNPTHPATAQTAAGGRSVLSPWSTVLTIVDPAGLGDSAAAHDLIAAYLAIGTPPFSSQRLLSTYPGDVWAAPRAEPLQPPAQLAAAKPFDVACALTYHAAATSVRQDRHTRLVVWASRQAASDGVLGLGTFANAALLADCCRWLANREAATDIPAAETAAFRVDCSDSALAYLTAILVAIIPCLFIGGAIIAWWERR
jgi:hypothetical protein